MLPSSRDKRVAVWDRAFSSPSRRQIRSIEVLESNIFAPQVIEFDRATAIVGTHGTGKTLLLRILEHCFGGWTGVDGPPYLEREVRWPAANKIAGVFKVAAELDGQLQSETVDLSESHEVRSGRWRSDRNVWFGPEFASPMSMVYGLAIYFQDFYPPDAEDIADIQRSKASDLVGLRAVTGRAYDSLNVGRIHTDYMDAPHFDVVSSGQRYDNSMMSFGELWATYALCWVTDRLGGHPLLLDEPEAFISTRGHRPLIDEVARRSLRSGSQFLVATHAPNIIARYPLSNVRLCVRSEYGIRVVVPQSASQIFDSIGVDIPTSAILFVEDNFALTVLNEVCSALDPYLLRGAEIVAAGGESEAVAGSRVMRGATRMRSVAILDGDRRGKFSDASTLFLPGASDPERELVSAAGRNPVALSISIDRTADDVVAALDVTTSSDHQYWIAGIARYLSLDEAVLVRALVGIWLRNPQIAESAADLLASLRLAIHARK